MSKETDHDLVNKALQGRQKAYCKLMSRYRDNIYYYILRMVGNVTTANDLTAETFDKAFRNLTNYNNCFAFSTWLYKIAHNATIDFLRQRKNPTLYITYGSEKDSSVNENTLQSEILDPEENMIRQQEEMFITKQIEGMSPKYRQLIELRYVKEYAYEEIAEELGIPLGTVKTQLHRAKSKLADILLSNISKKDLKMRIFDGE
ncbi:MAG: sigma-70 family RNA polymerase sigma factor [Prevotellaceae bacterium]|jgi:RNA polymerase sigma-70 factor (ECF subfamily)|nr:sigma-70 family RNA polymerase sigma factor [Prevotellaceae bacterium]